MKTALFLLALLRHGKAIAQPGMLVNVVALVQFCTSLVTFGAAYWQFTLPDNLVNFFGLLVAAIILLASSYVHVATTKDAGLPARDPTPPEIGGAGTA